MPLVQSAGWKAAKGGTAATEPAGAGAAFTPLAPSGSERGSVFFPPKCPHPPPPPPGSTELEIAWAGP